MDAPKQFNFRFYSWSSQLINLFMAVTLKKSQQDVKPSQEENVLLKMTFN